MEPRTPPAVARYAVFGHPIAHSLSPAIHAAFARQFGIELVYTTIDTAPADFDATVRRFFADGGAGANVTLPHKGAALALADRASPAATRAGTANVLTPLADGALEADNTDGAGLVRDLIQRHGETLRGRDVLLLGAGGAAHGVAGSLLDSGIAHLTIVNRTAARAETLAQRLREPARVSARPWNALATLGSFDFLINATSSGVTGQTLALPGGVIGSNAVCYDLAYGDAADPFLAWARSAGARLALDGLGMLVETAADAFERWHGKRPATDPVYRQLREARAKAL